MNILPKDPTRTNWPKCSFFGVFDGHGGDDCANFLRDNLHKYVSQNYWFPEEPRKALEEGFKQCEEAYLHRCQQQEELETAGSCAIVILVVEDMVYTANVGDSRAVLSADDGETGFKLSRDHKPDDEDEKKRIYSKGGEVYKARLNSKLDNGVILGPSRVLPGRLAVSRTFGDIEAKLPKYGGKRGVVSAEPEVK
jgi:protein phosphatase 2C family protein 2/3